MFWQKSGLCSLPSDKQRIAAEKSGYIQITLHEACIPYGLDHASQSAQVPSGNRSLLAR